MAPRAEPLRHRPHGPLNEQPCGDIADDGQVRMTISSMKISQVIYFVDFEAAGAADAPEEPWLPLSRSATSATWKIDRGASSRSPSSGPGSAPRRRSSASACAPRMLACGHAGPREAVVVGLEDRPDPPFGQGFEEAPGAIPGPGARGQGGDFPPVGGVDGIHMPLLLVRDQPGNSGVGRQRAAEARGRTTRCCGCRIAAFAAA